MIRGVLFDMDGVLIDSEPLWQSAEIEAFAGVGVALTTELCRRTRGLKIDEVVAYWRERAPWRGPSPQTVRERIVSGVVERIRTGGRALPGVCEALDLLRDLGLPLGIATSSDYRIVDAVVERLGIREHFAAIHSAQDEPRGKPHPDVYLGAAGKLGIEPGLCLAVEDSPAGVRAAIAAGMRCLAIPEAAREGRALEPDERDAFEQAHAVCPSLDILGRGEWEKLLAR